MGVGSANQAAGSDRSAASRELLAQLKLFRGVSRDTLDSLLDASERYDAPSGGVVLTPDEPNGSLYVVLSGELEVRVGAVDAVAISTLTTGHCAGEMSIIEERAPSAYVVAIEAAHLLVVPRLEVWKAVDSSHALAKNLLVMLSERVRQHNDVIAERTNKLRKVQSDAMTDALTSLGNRSWMQDMFPRELERCHINHEPAAMIMVDVDDFKRYNDRFGHVAGDRVLALVARALRDQFRPRDLIARFGGDEFAVLLPGIGTEQAAAIGERARRAISGTSSDADDSLVRFPVNVSIGVAEKSAGDSLDTLLRKADAALYRAKHAGRNCVSA
ncbi:MAG: GGDEF domain-containing protein [Pseudomonadota bacterium]